MTSITREEANKFALYLEQLARDNDALAKQVDALGSPVGIAKKLRAEEMAASIIAERLLATEFHTVTIGEVDTADKRPEAE